MKFPLSFLFAASALVAWANGPDANATIRFQEGPKVQLVPISSNTLVFDMLESADGSRLLTHDRQYSPRLWEPKSMSLLRVLGGNSESVDFVCLSGNGQRILTGSNSEARIWDAQRATVLSLIPSEEGASFVCGALSSDGKRLALGLSTGEVRFMDLANPLVQNRQKLSSAAVLSLQWNPTDQFAGTSADAVAVWKPDGTKVLALNGLKSAAFAELNPQGSQLLVTAVKPRGPADSGPLTATATSYAVTAGTQLGSAPHFFAQRLAAGSTNADPYAHFVGKQGELVATFASDGVIDILDAKTFKPVRKLEGNTAAIREVRVSTDKTKVATYSDAGEMFVFDVLSGKSLTPSQIFPNPTAATFSADSQSFWIGYEDGAIRKYLLEKDEYQTRQIEGSVAIDNFEFLGDSSWLHVRYRTGSSGFGRTYAHRYWDLVNGDAPVVLPELRYELKGSPSGTFQWPDLDEAHHLYRMNLRPGPKSGLLGGAGEGETFRVVSNSLPEEIKDFAFDAEDKFAAIELEGGVMVVADIENEGKDGSEVSFRTAPEKANDYENIYRKVFFRDRQSLLISGFQHEGKSMFARINHRTGKLICTYNNWYGLATQVAISKDDKWVACAMNHRVSLYDAATGKPIFERTLASDDDQIDGLAFSPDLQALVIQSSAGVLTMNTKTGAFTPLVKCYGLSPIENRIHPSKPEFLAWKLDGKLAMFDWLTGEVVSTVALNEQAARARFTPDGAHFVTADPTDGLCFFDTEPKAVTTATGTELVHKRLAQMVTLIDRETAVDDPRHYTWLVLDPEGRYDAPDPSHVNSAKYVLRWDNGLEPISVNQFKQQFYEPGLLGKILGSNKEALRPVPNLESLRLYPEIRVTRNQRRPNSVDIALTERDHGGIGQVRVFLNGKEIATKSDVGYFSLDLTAYKTFFLPETMLREDHKTNVLEVTATNQAGTLTSPPAELELGIPADLAVPDVHIHALFAGTSDYVGSTGDLSAPSNDAIVLGRTFGVLAENLLPGKVDITTLATTESDPTKRPTRANIIAWFERMKGVAGAGDIVLIFFSGHGTSQIGDRSGYFYLTADANPAEMGPLTASTATISGDDLRLALAAIPAKKQVVILDTCHSGAVQQSLFESRTLPSDYQRAYESIRESTGTWVLAGSAADQLSYEAANVEHGMLTYSLLEAIDKATGDGLREAPGGELFLDVRSWLRYAAERVESLKNDVGLQAIQRPELKASPTTTSFDMGVMSKDKKGLVGLKPPKPIVLLGTFSQDEEDPLNLEHLVQKELQNSAVVKYWPDVTKHPHVYRVAGTYSTEGDSVAVKVFLQWLDQNQQRTTKVTFTTTVKKKDLDQLGTTIRSEVEKRILEFENKGNQIN